MQAVYIPKFMLNESAKVQIGISYTPDSANTGAGGVFRRHGQTILEKMWTFSKNGTPFQGEFCAVTNSFRELLSMGVKDCSVQMFIDCASIVIIFTSWSQPNDNIDIIDETRELLQILKNRGVRITMNWIPSHIGIQWNERVDVLAKQGAVQALSMVQPPNISYSTAKRAIAIATHSVMQEHWDSHTTNLRKHKPILNPTPYTNVGSSLEIRFRTRAKLGNDPLNFSQFRFSSTVTDTHCPFCPGVDETVDHFLCKCRAYSQLRTPLYRKFIDVYPRRSVKFDHIGLLHEPITKAATETHLPIIGALNTFITAALKIRKDRQFLHL